MPFSRTVVGWCIVTFLLGASPEGFSTIYYSKTEAMDLAFGDDPQTEMMLLFLTEQQVGQVEKTARIKLESAFFTFYRGTRSGKVLGYAAIESHTVRTKPETLLIILSPNGELRQIEVLAFHEPPEYQPTRLWFSQFYRRALAQLGFNAEVQGITGATLSAQSALNSVRKVLAIYNIVVKGN